MSEEFITISKKRYKELCEAKEELEALYVGGVDNWDWYYESLKNAGLVDDEENVDESD